MKIGEEDANELIDMYVACAITAQAMIKAGTFGYAPGELDRCHRDVFADLVKANKGLPKEAGEKLFDFIKGQLRKP